jgi:ferric-dicitrate binding protein FerR (iron transport regulator)
MNMKDYKEYADRYFEGSLSEAEEQELKDFLSSSEGQSHEYDELRAVMGFFAVGKGLSEASRGPAHGSEASRPVRNINRIYSRIAVAAACLLVLLGIGFGIYSRRNYCVTFYKGAKITKSEVVMEDVESTLAELMSSDTDVYDQLSDFFNNGEE